MKLTKLINLTALAATLTLAGAGCRKTTLGSVDISTGSARPPRNPNAMAMENQPPIRNNQPIAPYRDPTFANNHNPIPLSTTGDDSSWTADPSNPLGPQTIHFDYDKSAIKASEQSKLEAVASYMQSHPNVHVRIEGNCDERGTEEYNRSLGERRALAGREHLAQAGINPDRVSTITYGEDKPVDTARNESAYAKNRRDDFVVLLPPR